MSERENIHAGHRERMLKKLIDNSDNLLDYEVLEILLFSMLPRVNTNPIAHKLINTFGGIRNVLSASVTELCAVNGIGEKTARQIRVLGVLFERVLREKNSNTRLTCFDVVKKEVFELFENQVEEKFYLFLLDANYKKISVFDFCNDNSTSVNAEVTDIAKAFALYKPKHAIIAHNHTSGLIEPSENDDLSTKKINLLCMAHGVNLADHVIYSNGSVFSYSREGRLDEIKKKADLNALLRSL